MGTNYPMGYISQGVDFNQFQIISVSSSVFGGNNAPFYLPSGVQDGYSPDFLCGFSTYGIQFVNMGSGSTNIVEYSFNGNTVHGQSNPADSTVSLSFTNRVVSAMWFRVKSGSTGPINFSVQIWGIR